ncbi:MAG: riboflavin synthase [Candidatus Omnitrophota bacterium]
MFTGIIEKTALVKSIAKNKNAYKLQLSFDKKPDLTKLGDSISVNGVCLTVVGIQNNLLEFDVMGETFSETSLRNMKCGEIVNIEMALKADSRMDGHFVLGHVDCARKIKLIEKGDKPYLDVSILPVDKMYVVKKGSIAVDGISLTIGEVFSDTIRVFIIPYTLKNTNLERKKCGSWVNIEFDILGKYIINKAVLNTDVKSGITKGFLKTQGFV